MKLEKDQGLLVTGAGGFIGGHLVAALLAAGYTGVRAVDLKPVDEWHQRFGEAENLQLDLQVPGAAQQAVEGCRYVLNLAADMGGMGFIENNKALCMLSVLINTNLLQASRASEVERYFFSSSACVYAAEHQTHPDVTALREDDAYPAMPEDGYGWEKLFSERMCRHFDEDFGLETRVARYHNVYGPCFDAETEVLTDQGWRLFGDLDRTEQIASLDPESGVVEYQTPVAWQAHLYDGDMYRVSSPRGVDQAVTADHSLFVGTKTSKGVTWGLRQASELQWDMARLWFSSHGVWEGKPVEVTLPAARWSDQRRRSLPARTVDPKLWFEFAGWYLSEGSHRQTSRNSTVNIAQVPGAKHERIKSCIRGLGFSCHSNGENIVVSSRQLWQAVAQFGRGAPNKRIPRWMLDAERPLLMALFSAMLAGGGEADGRRYATRSAGLADDMQELALRLGIQAEISHESEMSRVNLSERLSTETRRTSRWIEHYRGPVYDVTLPRHHILMVRRRGKPSWSGNCGTWHGGREKAPAAICRKVAQAKLTGGRDIEIWGDGKQTRSFTYIDDCVTGTMLVFGSDYPEPLNVGSSELVTIDQLVDIVCEIAGVQLERRYDVDAPKGVRGRNSDNTLIKEVCGWEPSTRLADGLEVTYRWIHDQVAAALAVR